MSQSLPDRAVLDAIKVVAERIDQLHIEALSSGIGLGTPRPRRVATPSVPLAAPRSLAALPKLPIAPTQLQRPLPKAPAKRPSQRSSAPGWGLSSLRMILAHGADLSVITLVLAVGSYALAYALGQRLPWHGAKILAELGLVNLLLILYVVFCFYWVFCKVLTGRTIGQYLLPRSRQNRSLQTKQSPIHRLP